MKEIKLCFGGGPRNVLFEGPKLVHTWLDQILQLTIFTLLAVTHPCCSKFQPCILECDTSVVAALVLRHCQCNYGYLTLVDLQVRRGGGGGERPDLPNSPLSLRESSLNHAQSHNSQLEFTRGFYVKNFLTLKSASSRGMKVCTNSSGPILASRSWQKESVIYSETKQNEKICIKGII